tara:strand:+ start:4108 stop:4863 length:756 start_codon:yes stop_codon:yes gene_type:complete
MGLFGGGDRKTTNEDNRIINDYANASWDNSVRNEYSNELNGDFNNNTGTITMIDPNAIEGALSISENAMGLADSVVGSNTYLADSAMNNNTLLADSAMGHMKSVNSDSLTFADGVMSNALDSVNGIAGDSLEFASGALDSGFDSMRGLAGDSMALAQSMGAYSIDAAMNFADNASFQQQSNNELVLALAGNAREQNAENNQALTDGFEQMMQFTEQFSRSDGAAVAETNTKTVGFMVAGLVAVMLLSKGLK